MRSMANSYFLDILMPPILRALVQAALLCCTTATVHAQTVLPDGNTNVICMYTHTLPDDPIIYPSQPGIAMQHDFFGNTSTNGSSTGNSLLAAPANTCENVADSTAYWVPALRLPNGTVVQPLYQKTYYTNVAVPSSLRYAVQPFPTGIQIIAGNHMGSTPQPYVDFLCTGSVSGYTHSVPTDCVPDPVQGTQLDVGISFPTCWDGTHLAPTVMTNGYNNMAYAGTDGTCPVGYPVRLPHISLNVAYGLGQATDLTGTQLSLDPTLDTQGHVVQQNWGSIYTAHGDFLDAWQPQSAQFMADYCLNKGRDCDRTLPYSYAEPRADATVTGGAAHATNQGRQTTLVVQTGVGSVAQSTAFLEFAIPAGAAVFPSNYTPQYLLMLYGGNTTDSAADMLYFYVTAASWQEKNITYDNAPVCGGSYVGRLYLDNAQQYRTIDLTAAVNAALAAGKSQLSICIQGSSNDTRAFTFSSREGANKPVLYLYGDNPLPF